MCGSAFGVLRPLLSVMFVLSLAGFARASSDPDVDVAIAIIDVDGKITKDEHARYKGSLEKYADLRQRLLLGMGRLIEADEDEVDGKWDQICDGGLSGLSELEKEVPETKVQLKEFYATEKAIWEVLKKVQLPNAEEAENKTRKMVDTVLPALEKKLQEILDEDRKADDEAAKRREATFETAKILLRMINEVANPSDVLKDVFDKMLENGVLVKATYQQCKATVDSEIAQHKSLKQARELARAINEAVRSADEASMKAYEQGKADMSNVLHKKGVAAQAERWLKVTEAHFATTREKVKKYNEFVAGRLVGNINDETKSRIGDAEFYKNLFSRWEDDGKAIEEGLNRLDKLVDEYRDGDFKKEMKERVSKCREAIKECASIRAAFKSDYESALSDAELK